MPVVQIALDLWVLMVPIVFHCLGLVFIADVIMCGRTSQGTVAWIMALLLFPYLSVFLYLVFGSRRIKDYTDARRSGEKAIHMLGRDFQRKKDLSSPTALDKDPRISALSGIARMPMIAGNRCSLLINGSETFDSIFEGIASAEHYVLVQFFIIHDDDLGRRLKDACIDRAKAGVRIYFLYDKIGSVGLPRSYKEELTEAGVRLSVFRVGKGVLNRFRVNFRNHRKIVVVDGRISWVGGHNVGDAYLGKDKRFDYWRDTHVKMEGPVSLAVQLSFVEDWHWATGDLPDVSWGTSERPGTEKVLCIPTGPSGPVDAGSLWIVLAINMSRKRCWIMSPYFVPDGAVITALQLAAMRGVDVRIVIPANPDKRVVWWAAHSYVDEMAVAGVKMYTYQKGFMHQKVNLIDDSLASIGTANLDNRSLRINFEITMIFTDPAFIKEIADMCQNDLSECRPMKTHKDRPWSLPFRLATRASRLLSPIL